MDRLERPGRSAGPRIRYRAVSKISTTVTSTPSFRSDAATSAPMNPMPTHDDPRAARRRPSWIALGVVGVRSSKHARRGRRPATSSRRLRTPGRHERRSNGDAARRPRATPRARAASICTARVPSRGSTSCSAYHSAGRTKAVLERLLAAQVLLRQRRPLVGRHRFVADQDEPAVEPLAAQRGRRGAAGERGPDDDERPVGARLPSLDLDLSVVLARPRRSRSARSPAPRSPRRSPWRRCCRGTRTRSRCPRARRRSTGCSHGACRCR